MHFPLEPDEDGWPPVSSEGLWAEPVGPGLYRLDNAPFFVTGVAPDDVVEAAADEDGNRQFVRVVQMGGRVVARVVPRRDGPLGGDLRAVLDAFAPLGVTGEGADPAYPLVALDIGPGIDRAAAKRLLVEGQADGRWYYDEGCVDDEWRALG